MEDLQQGWQNAKAEIQSRMGEADFDGLVAELVGGIDQRKKLVDLAACDADFSALIAVVGVRVGVGWQTQGMLGGWVHNLYLEDRQPMADATVFYDALCERAEKLEKSVLPELSSPPLSEAQVRRKRPVLLTMTMWPGGTMAFKFGSAIRHALCPAGDEVKLVQMEPVQIFRAETDVSEDEFRQAMEKTDVSCSGRLIFVEM